MNSINRYYTPEYVGERLKLAAEADKSLPKVGPARVKSAHPATLSMVSDAFMFGENWRENLRLKIEQTTRVSPTRESMREMDEAMGWLAYLDGPERRKALWCWAVGIPQFIIASRFKKSRQTIATWRDESLETIARRLNTTT